AELREPVVRLSLLGFLRLGLVRLRGEAAAHVAEKQVELAGAVPVDHARLDAQSPVARQALVVAAPADGTLLDENSRGFELRRLRSADVAIPDDAAALGADDQVEPSVAIPVGGDRRRVAADGDRLACRFKSARRAEGQLLPLALVRNEVHLAENVADNQVQGAVAVPVDGERSRGAADVERFAV